jgi:hypothetical protein
MPRVHDGMESWRCGCGTWNRSWWRTSDREVVAGRVAARRADEARVMPQLPRPAVALAVFSIVAAVLFTVVGPLSSSSSSSSSSSAGAGDAAVCAAARDYRSRVATGGSASVSDVVDRLNASSGSVSAPVRAGVARVTTAARDANPEVLLGAIGALTEACGS